MQCCNAMELQCLGIASPPLLPTRSHAMESNSSQEPGKNAIAPAIPAFGNSIQPWMQYYQAALSAKPAAGRREGSCLTQESSHSPIALKLARALQHTVTLLVRVV